MHRALGFHGTGGSPSKSPGASPTGPTALSVRVDEGAVSAPHLSKPRSGASLTSPAKGSPEPSPRRLPPLASAGTNDAFVKRTQSVRTIVFGSDRKKHSGTGGGASPSGGSDAASGSGGASSPGSGGKPFSKGRFAAALYLVNHLAKRGGLTPAEKRTLKELALQSDPKIRAALEVWDADGDFDDACDTMWRIGSIAASSPGGKGSQTPSPSDDRSPALSKA